GLDGQRRFGRNIAQRERQNHRAAKPIIPKRHEPSIPPRPADGAGFEDVRLNSCSTEADIAFPRTLTPPGERIGCIGIVTIAPTTKCPIVIMVSRSSRRRSSVQVRSVWKVGNLARPCSFLTTFYRQVGIFPSPFKMAIVG